MAELTCPTCHAAISPGARFCAACGATVLLPASAGTSVCFQHPDIVAIQPCSRCGNFACAQCLVARPSGALVCSSCAQREPLEPLPWDEREKLGWVRAYWQTCWRLVMAPSTFSSTSPEGSVGSSMLFAFVSSVAGLVTTVIVYAILFGTMFASSLFDKVKDRPPPWVIPLGVVAYFFFALAMMWGLQLLFSALDHLVLKVLGVEMTSWQVTYRASCLSMAPYIVGLIPLCGLYVFPFWSLVLKVYAYRGFHRTTLGKASAAALIPVLGLGFCCVGGYVVLIFVFMGKLAKDGAFPH